MLLCCLLFCTVFGRFSRAQEVKHLFRELTFCHFEMMDAGFELEFDGEELWHVEPTNYIPHRRLPEFAGDWSFDRGLPHEAYVSIGTCFYNIPRCTAGEKDPPESISPPTTLLYTKRDMRLGVKNTLICSVSNFHPPPVNISWTRNGDPVDEQDISQTQYYSDTDYTFRVFSYLSFSPQQGDVYTCSVQHRGLTQDVTRFWEVDVPEDDQDVEVAVLVVGILVGFLGFVAGIIIIVMSKLEPLTV